ncbi:hypothetical protein LJC41_01390 [Desulfosarcina sp. OttesenSCG-928-G17]|nr:hypothetical protein [Desulfosarcina sp. OttesenSCG-928-G17]
MKIYKIIPSKNYEFCHPIGKDGFLKLNKLINGEKRLKNWVPFKMELINEDMGEKLISADSPGCGSNILILNQTIKDKMEEMFGEYGEILPIECGKTKNLFVFNVLKFFDNAVDVEKSSLVRYKNGDIMFFEKIEFFPEVIINTHIFKITNLRVSPIFFDEYFVNFWKSNKLTGIDFDKVWEI